MRKIKRRIFFIGMLGNDENNVLALTKDKLNHFHFQ
jgi:hypothetical protein